MPLVFKHITNPFCQCDGGLRGYPCTNCTKLITWKEICIQFGFDEKCFGRSIHSILGQVLPDTDFVGIYLNRCKIMHSNVEMWIPSSEVPLVTLKIGIGLSARLEVSLNKFVPIQEDWLEHISFRCQQDTTNALHRKTKSQPFALFESSIRPAQITSFIDDMIPELISDHQLSERNPICQKTLSAAYEGSQDPNLSKVRTSIGLAGLTGTHTAHRTMSSF